MFVVAIYINNGVRSVGAATQVVGSKNSGQSLESAALRVSGSASGLLKGTKRWDDPKRTTLSMGNLSHGISQASALCPLSLAEEQFFIRPTACSN